MRKMLKRSVSGLLTVCMMFAMRYFDVTAAEFLYDSSSLTEEVMEEYNDLTKVRDNDFADRNYNAAVNYNAIMEHIYAEKDSLSEHFSGAYVNDEGMLNVALNCQDDDCKKIITDELGCSNIIFIKGAGSYIETMGILESINTKIAQLQEQVNCGVCTDADIFHLMSAYPRAEYNSELNTISIVFDVSTKVEQVVTKAENLEGMGISILSDTYMSVAEQEELEEYNDYISEFERFVGNYDSVDYETSTGYEPLKTMTEAWRPGRAIYILTSSTTVSGYSTGYRATYNYNGTTYYGFVTSAHGNSKGKSVYLSTTTSTTNKIGVIVDRKLSGTVDVSFIDMDESKYTNGLAVYYTSSEAGVTRPGTILDGTQTAVAVGNEIYKSGQTTYLTYGTVASVTASAYFNTGSSTVLLSNLIQVNKAMAKAGDSGAVTYICDSGSTGKTVGIVEGGSSSVVYFIRADEIRSSFGAAAY